MTIILFYFQNCEISWPLLQKCNDVINAKSLCRLAWQPKIGKVIRCPIYFCLCVCVCVRTYMCAHRHALECCKKQYWRDMSSFGCHCCFIWMPLGVSVCVHTHADLRKWVDGNTKSSLLVSLLVKVICKVAKKWKDTGSPVPQFLFAVF